MIKQTPLNYRYNLGEENLGLYVSIQNDKTSPLPRSILQKYTCALRYSLEDRWEAARGRDRMGEDGERTGH